MLEFSCCVVWLSIVRNIVSQTTQLWGRKIAEVIIGREEEIALLKEKLSSVSAEFIVVYGRRRVGKTYLIKQFFTQQTGVYFEQTGINNGSLQEQLNVFSESLSKSFYRGVSLTTPKSWMEALTTRRNLCDPII